MTATIELAVKTSYMDGTTELWDTRRIAHEYDASLTTVIHMIRDDPNFPKPYARALGGKKMFFVASEILNWAETTPRARQFAENQRRGTGKPRTKPQGLVVHKS
jgi:predicted DNA-binding transcriptional regulator AlpA